MMEKAIILRKLHYSELQFKLALAVSTTCHSSNEPALRYLGAFSWGKHFMDSEELSLTIEEEKLASSTLELSATYLMTLQLDEVLEKFFSNRFEHSNCSVQNGAFIVHLIRNAFAHDPLSPTWLIPAYCKNKVFNVEGIISLNTNELNKKKLKRSHYGGQIALLRLLQYFSQLIAEDTL